MREKFNFFAIGVDPPAPLGKGVWIPCAVIGKGEDGGYENSWFNHIECALQRA